jgi:hypothetical protein
MGSGAKSYMRKTFLIYEEMHKYFHHTVYEEVVMTFHPIPPNFLIYEENFIFFFISVHVKMSAADGHLIRFGRRRALPSDGTWAAGKETGLLWGPPKAARYTVPDHDPRKLRSWRRIH